MKVAHITSIICSLIIGTSLIIGCLIISTKDVTETKQELTIAKEQEKFTNSPLLNIKQAAEYLNLKEEQVTYIIQSEQNTLNTMGSFTGERFPYFKINNEIFISKTDLTKWLKDVTTQRREYTEGLAVH
ncbi:helix-turn-helix domain-containing protein [Paenibacillus sp. YPG26]|uniref:helix-turn-helix domain-containing protein n=1 Tax=Paenibacillus sp. YPG26 TaxID=2878915 RepID=UPI00203E5690|nr:helix-turn-helix domain-containing protein [Paenibacillus sp. YPG26]USB33378.1 helix-turn-helix domain-containing protein [Paenibacillus sp. YPG26]